ncbi:hypothetical protein [Aquabacterium sp. NJ1]|uniref:hypothetical protein n=1 Tax=Aquabacterium sp. NJ1 TaxID=1538295 RepID=UPI00068F6B7B|nr:hypothetical protein [Aquabacterium sp. NJ1]
MSDEKKTTTIRDVQSTHNDVGMHIGSLQGNLHVIGGKFSHGKVGVMIGGDPSKIVEANNPSHSSTVHVHGDVNAPLNVATGKGASIANLTVGDILAKIDASNATPEEKLAAKSKFKEFMAHPLVTSIVGGLAGGIPGALGS